MFKAKSLQELIEENIPLGRENGSGWRAVRCAVCNDHSERGAFKFDGVYTGFSDFNCGAKFKYEEGSSKLSRDAVKILEAFGLTKTQLDQVTSANFFNKNAEAKEITLESMAPKIQLFTPEIQLPPKSHPLGSPFSDDLQAPLIEYLLERDIDPIDVKAHFSLDPKYLMRVIIPCIRDGKVIYWQARTIAGNVRPKYISPSINKEAVFWGYDNLWKNQDQPLFCTEGIFDAVPIQGVALLGSKLNDSKIEILNRSRRTKIIVVDRDENGAALAQLALENGWEITFPPKDCADVNASVKKIGKLATIWTLMKNRTVPSGIKTTRGTSVQSELTLAMEMALMKMKRK